MPCYPPSAAICTCLRTINMQMDWTSRLAFTLHIRQQDRLVTLFIPLGDIQATSLANMADWPILQLSNTDERNTLLWAREWLDKLNQEIMVDLISRMLHKAEALTLNCQPSTTLSDTRQLFTAKCHRGNLSRQDFG